MQDTFLYIKTLSPLLSAPANLTQNNSQKLNKATTYEIKPDIKRQHPRSFP